MCLYLIKILKAAVLEFKNHDSGAPCGSIKKGSLSVLGICPSETEIKGLTATHFLYSGKKNNLKDAIIA